VHPLESYLHELDMIRASGAGVPETSGYGALATLLTAIGATFKPKSALRHQPAKSGRGAAGWRAVHARAVSAVRRWRAAVGSTAGARRYRGEKRRHTRQPLHEGGADAPLTVGRRHLVRRIHAGEHRSAGEHPDHGFQHVFRTAELVEPVVDKRDAGRPAGRLRAGAWSESCAAC
jgi:hypothetical protein